MERLIELIKYIILAIVQGVGEVLPISSSGHLLLVRKLFSLGGEDLSLEIFLHLASLLALFIYYHKTIFALVRGFFLFVFKKNKEYYRDFKFVIGMIISLIPTCLIGFFFDDYIDAFLKYSYLIGLFLVLNGINLYLVKKKESYKKIEDMPNFSFFRIGIGQCLGLIPGFSRSGACLSMCYREKMDKEDSEKFTFIMLFPLVMGSVFLNINDFSFDNNSFLLIISFIVVFIVSFLSLGLLKKIVRENKLYYFTYYCLIVGALVMFIC